MIILPAIDIRGGKCVRLQQGDYAKETCYADHPAEQAKEWQEKGGEIIHLVDLDGAKDGYPTNLEVVREICKSVDVPCELGGGIRSFEDAKRMLEAGVARVIVGTAAYKNPELLSDLIKEFGSEKVVLGIDAKNGKVAISGWLDTTDMEALDLAKDFVEKGIRRIIYTDIATDGMLKGPNYEEMARICDHVPNCQIIASGGVSCLEDIQKLKELNKDNLEGVIVGKALYDGKITLEDAIKV